VQTPQAVQQQPIQSKMDPSSSIATAPSSSTSSAAVSKAASEPKQGKAPTLFQILTKANIDWCRYCGTTEGVNWRPGPWGKRTLCNKHGCDFKGYGFACKLPRLDLTSYAHETVDQRIRPVLQHCRFFFCFATSCSLCLSAIHSNSYFSITALNSLPRLPIARIHHWQCHGPLRGLPQGLPSKVPRRDLHF